MSWVQTYLIFCSIYLASIIVLYFTGKSALLLVHKFSRFGKLSLFEDLFASLVLGMIIVVFIFSASITHLKTVNVLILPIGILFFIFNKRDRSSDRSQISLLPTITIRQLASLLFYALLIYSFFACEIIRKQDWSSLLKVPNLFDWGLYGADMHMMVRTGQENHTHVHPLLDNEYSGMTLYHFFEIWLSGIWYSIFPRLLPVYLLTLVSYSLLTFLAVVGSWALLSNFEDFLLRYKFLVLVTFFSAGWFFINSGLLEGTILQPFLKNLQDMNQFLVFLPKRLPSYIFLLIFLLIFIRRNELLAFICLLLMPVASIDSVPAIYGGTFLYGLLSLRKDSSKIRTWVSIGVIYILFAMAFIALYKCYGNKNILLYNPVATLRQLLKPEPGTALFPFLFFGRAIVQLLILYAVHFGIAYFLIRNHPQLKRIYWILFLLVLSGAVGWGVLYSYIDGIQFFVGTLTICQTIVLVTAITLLSPSNKLFLRLFVTLYLIGSAIFSFSTFYLPKNFKASLPDSESYLQSISTLTPKSRVGICIESRHDFEVNWGHRNVMVHALGDNYLIFMPQYLKAVQIGGFDVPETAFRNRPEKIPLLGLPLNFHSVDSFRTQMMKQSGIFYRFFEKMRDQYPNSGVEEAQVAFIDYYKIDWGIVSDSAAISPLFEKRILQSFTDTKSGERFVLLKIEPTLLKFQ